MKKEDLRETKIYLSNVEDRKKFQKKMSILGIQLEDDIATLLNLDACPFFYIDEDYSLYAVESSEVGKVAFLNEDEYEQVFLDDILSIMDYNFKPYDKVLVRDSSNTRWKPKLFAFHNVDYDNVDYDKDYPFETTDGGFFRYCIPYDEDLANTTKNI